MIASISTSWILGELLLLSITGSVIAIFAMLIAAVVGRRLAPNWIYLIWILVLVRFAIVVTPSSPTSFQNLFSDNRNSVVVNVVEETQDETDMLSQSIVTWILDEPPESTESKTTVGQTFLPSSSQILLIVWASVAAWLLLRLGVAWRKIRRSIINAKVLPDEILTIFDQSKAWTAYDRSVDVKVTEDFSTPASTGFLHPTVLIPQWCCQQLGHEELRCVFIHELTHLKRRDNWIHALTYVIGIFHWFNPLVRLALNRAESFRELACDHSVIEILKRFKVESATKIYGNTILKVATNHPQFQNHGNPVLVGGFVNCDKNLTKQRIAMLVSQNSKMRFSGILAALGIVSILAVGFTSAQSVQEEPTPTIATKPTINEQMIFAQPTKAVVDKSDRIAITVGESKQFEFKDRVPQLLVTKPDVAETTPIDPSTILVSGKELGRTSVIATFASGETQTLQVNVQPALNPNTHVILETSFLVLSKTKLKKTKSIDWIQLGDLDADHPSMCKVFNLLVNEGVGSDEITAGIASDSVEFLQLFNDLKSLSDEHAEPVIVAGFDRPANFLCGGELPITKENESGVTEIEFEPFGLNYVFTPSKVDNSDKIRLDLTGEISIVKDGKIDVVRKLKSGIELDYNETFSVIGSFVDDGVEKEAALLITPKIAGDDN